MDYYQADSVSASSKQTSTFRGAFLLPVAFETEPEQFLMQPKQPPSYLAGYNSTLIEQVQRLIDENRMAETLLAKYPRAHAVRTDKALFNYVQQLRAEFVGNSGPLSLVAYDSKLHVIRQALGTHTSISRVQGTKLKAKREIRISSLFRDMPPEFLRMIVVHELAHMKEREHGKAFYQLCEHMEPAYHQREFDLRVYLHYLELTRQPLWPVAGG